MRRRAVAAAAGMLRLMCRRRAWAFREALETPAMAQRRLLARLIRPAARTEYGQSLGLRPDDGLRAFRAKVPIVTYDDLAEWVQRQKAGKDRVMVAEGVRCFEKTSGSTGAAKYIPYTAGLLGSFQSLFRIWAYDLLTQVLRPQTGKLFASVSPAFRDESTTAAGVPVGLKDDSDYLNGALRWLLRAFLVAPRGLFGLAEPDDFRDVLAATLVAEPGLEVISVWNPSFLLILLDHLTRHRGRLMAELQTGRLVRGDKTFSFAPFPPRRCALLEISAIPWHELWPRLQLISCWTSSAARVPAARLQALFPGCRVQGKGLIATEAPVTVPLVAASGGVPLVDEVFLEFEDAAGEIRLVQELPVDEEYRLIISQKGGLLRYRLGDRVRVVGRFHNTPCLEFLGRDRDVSDLVGEKLHEAFVEAALNEVLPEAQCRLLVPVQANDLAWHYVLLTEQEPPSLAEHLDGRLRHAFHYRNARLLGQLGPLRVVAAPDMRSRIHGFFAAKGLAWGNIKDCFLFNDPTQGTQLVAAVTDPPPHTRPACTG